MPHNHSPNPYRRYFPSVETEIPLLDGSHRPYINLDNAASTPPIHASQEAVNAFMPYYSSVHRGTGFKSLLSTHAYETARQVVIKFVGANPGEHICIFGKNTTEAINKLARRFPFDRKRNVVLTSGMEHHSNDLPWRAIAKTVHVGLTPDGRLDENDFDRLLERYAGNLALVAITGASNVTGFLNPVHRLAEKTHAAGAEILVDCAQLAPHRRVDMRHLVDSDHLDYVTISAHKMYAPFGTGALIGRRETFEHGDPDLTGGGTVEIVTLNEVVWTEPPDRDEAGSPNTVGAVALAAAIKQLDAIGMEHIAQHESELTEYALNKLTRIPEIRLYGDNNPSQSAERLGVIPMQLGNQSHFKTAAILGYEFGIGVRSGCFCAHPYILHLLGLTEEEAHEVRNQMLTGDRSQMPGMIRASFGLYNTFEEIDVFIEAMECISRGEYSGEYVQQRATGEYKPLGVSIRFDNYFAL